MSLEMPDAAVLEAGHRNLFESRMSDAAFQSDFLRAMQGRGYIHSISHPAELDAAAAEGSSSATSGSTRRRPRCTSAA